MIFNEASRFRVTLSISLALNLFFLPVIAGKWFWSSRAERMSLEELHPAEVKTVTLEHPKPPPPPKLSPKPKIVPPLRAPIRTQHAAAKPKARPAPAAPRPHVMTMEEGGNQGRGTPAVTQGTGQAGTPTAPEAPPAKSEPPPPRGPTREAAATSSPTPEIPDSLRSQVLKTFVRARFDIAADGTAQVTLLTSSGSPELDRITLQALRRWRWKPALKDGAPVSSVQRLRIEFEVQ